jgi:hypothetical protein
VSFATVDVEDAGNAEKLKQLTGELKAPVMQVGDKLIAKGFNEARWTAMLDDAGYPKSPPRRVATKAAEPAPAPAAAAPAPSPEATQALPVPGSGYPKP